MPVIDITLPPDPPNLQVAVKDYLAWMRDPKKPLNHPNFEEVKRRVVFTAISAIEQGKFCKDEEGK